MYLRFFERIGLKVEKRIQVDEHSVIYYWFDNQYQEKLRALDKQSVERQAIREVLLKLHPTIVLERKENGAPSIKDEVYEFISISHAKGWYAIYLSTNSPVGVDIQTPKKSLLKGKDYFINSREENFTKEDFNLHLIWCGKEAVFKKMNGLIDDLKEEVSTVELNTKENEIKMVYKNKIEISHYLSTLDFLLVWTMSSK